jgi:hypothetical protein
MNCTKEITFWGGDTWLIGFMEAEGCFHASFSLNKLLFLLFDLAQKEQIIRNSFE